MSADDSEIRLRVFVGRSFHPEDEHLWQEIRKILESLQPLGIRHENAKQPLPRPISEKVRDRIERNDVYIGILTPHVPVARQLLKGNLFSRLFTRTNETKISHSASPWVIQESGFALGRNRRVLLLVEEGVDFPLSDINADTEKIPFLRNAIPQTCAGPIVSMLSSIVAEKLPQALDTTGSVVAVVAPAPEQVTSEGDKLAPAVTEGATGEQRTLATVTELLNAANFAAADDLFNKVLAVEEIPWLKEWLPWYYLRLKASKGHSPSLRNLETAAAESKASALYQLAGYYSDFERYDESAKVLLDGSSKLPDRERVQMGLRAIHELAKGQQYSRAISLLGDLRPPLKDKQLLYSLFTTFAEVGKLAGRKDLESAALEQALSIEPGAGSLRFRLAYLYGECGAHSLSIYHYLFLVKLNTDPFAENNMAVALGSLKMPEHEIKLLKSASAKNPLAMANLSHAYVDRGFLDEAESLARQAATVCDEPVAAERTASALSRIQEVRTSEARRQDTIVEQARQEGFFRLDYADASLVALSKELEGNYRTPYGVLRITVQAGRLIGEATTTTKVVGGFNELLKTGPEDLRGLKVKTVRLEAEMTGRAGLFRMVSNETGDYTFAEPNRSDTRTGLLILDSSRSELQILEISEDSAKVFHAPRCD